jgi:hypothetical protein
LIEVSESLRPSRQVSPYDASVDPKDVQVLQFGYRHAFELPHQEQSLMRLFTKLAFVYGPAISHRSLHHALCAYLGHWSGSANNYEQELYHHRAVSALQLKLDNPRLVDEGDLFAVALLAMWAACYREDERFMAHTTGFASLVKHLSKTTNRSSYQLSPFWQMAQDEIILHAYGLQSGPEDEVTKALCSPGITAEQAFQERQEYQRLLSRQRICGVSVDGLFSATWQQFFVLRACFKEISKTGKRDSTHVEGVLVKVGANLRHYDCENMVRAFLMEAGECDKEQNADRWRYLDKAASIVCLLLCHFLVKVLEAPSVIEGMQSKDGISAGNLLLMFIYSVELMLFGYRAPVRLEIRTTAGNWSKDLYSNQKLISGKAYLGPVLTNYKIG